MQGETGGSRAGPHGPGWREDECVRSVSLPGPCGAAFRSRCARPRPRDVPPSPRPQPHAPGHAEQQIAAAQRAGRGGGGAEPRDPPLIGRSWRGAGGRGQSPALGRWAQDAARGRARGRRRRHHPHPERVRRGLRDLARGKQPRSPTGEAREEPAPRNFSSLGEVQCRAAPSSGELGAAEPWGGVRGPLLHAP